MESLFRHAPSPCWAFAFLDNGPEGSRTPKRKNGKPFSAPCHRPRGGRGVTCQRIPFFYLSCRRSEPSARRLRCPWSAGGRIGPGLRATYSGCRRPGAIRGSRHGSPRWSNDRCTIRAAACQHSGAEGLLPRRAVKLEIQTWGRSFSHLTCSIEIRKRIRLHARIRKPFP